MLFDRYNEALELNDRVIAMAAQKTNVMRALSQKKIAYDVYEYPHGDSAVDGVTVAALTGLDPDTVFKTLVCRGAGRNVYVFCVPVARELELKKAAAAVTEKSVSMVHVNEINALTGYVRGGCSPIGMKKQYRTVIHESALALDRIVVSAGKIGSQVSLSPQDLIRLTSAETADITSEV